MFLFLVWFISGFIGVYLLRMIIVIADFIDDYDNVKQLFYRLKRHEQRNLTYRILLLLVLSGLCCGFIGLFLGFWLFIIFGLFNIHKVFPILNRPIFKSTR